MRSTRVMAAGLLCLGGAMLLVFLFTAPRTSEAQDATSQESPTQINEEVFVPAGQFLMGCSPDLYTDGCDGDTFPIHAVHLDAFYIDRTEVTNAQYNACVAAGACPERLHCRSAKRSNLPSRWTITSEK